MLSDSARVQLLLMINYVIILDPGIPMQYRGLLMSQQVTFIYLDELEVTSNNSLGLGMVQLVVEKEETATDHTRE